VTEWRDLPVPAEPEPVPARPDYLGVTAIVLGCLGIVTAGLFLALPVAILAAIAGGRAREDGRSLDNAAIAFGLAVVDALVWIVLHLFVDFAAWAG
jgi:sterol desaturase/sphingolipid hydroxylase (fatty acid hydroxylase superfamily)